MFSILIHIYLSCVYRLYLLFNFFTSSPSKFWSVISFNCTLLPFAFSSERVSSLCLYFPLNMIITWVLRKIFALCIRHSFWLCVNLVHRIRSFIAFYYIYISVKTRVWHSTNYRKTHSNSILSLEKWRNIVQKSLSERNVLHFSETFLSLLVLLKSKVWKIFASKTISLAFFRMNLPHICRFRHMFMFSLH